mmetsp:Transcript_119820/g.339137  ORF Transcript_119820/g.339137 Transcript_119820/m.339137 type:complete len:214 (+) Transcript_119820:1152-1793(+)
MPSARPRTPKKRRTKRPSVSLTWPPAPLKRRSKPPRSRPRRSSTRRTMATTSSIAARRRSRQSRLRMPIVSRLDRELPTYPRSRATLSPKLRSLKGRKKMPRRRCRKRRRCSIGRRSCNRRLPQAERWSSWCRSRPKSTTRTKPSRSRSLRRSGSLGWRLSWRCSAGRSRGRGRSLSSGAGTRMRSRPARHKRCNNPRRFRTSSTSMWNRGRT